VQALLAASAKTRGVDNAQRDCGYGALHCAAAFGHTAVIRVLLVHKGGAQVDDTDTDGFTALHKACQGGHVEAARALVVGRANVHARTKQRVTPLQLAAQCGSVAVIRMLVRHAGARLEDKDCEGKTALHVASGCGRLNAAATLIAAGADLRAKMLDGRTPLAVVGLWHGAPAQASGRVYATAAWEPRRWLLHARAWLYGRERRAAAGGGRLCYGCARACARDAPGSGLCPRGCGGVPVPPAEDAVHDQWFCSPACYAAAAGRHRAVCDQGLRWAAAAGAPRPGTRVVVQGLVAQPALNGKGGVVVAPRSRAEARSLGAEGRVRVRMDAGAPRPVALKYANVRAVVGAAPAPQKWRARV